MKGVKYGYNTCIPQLDQTVEEQTNTEWGKRNLKMEEFKPLKN